MLRVVEGIFEGEQVCAPLMLNEIARVGAWRMLITALGADATDYEFLSRGLAS